MNGAHLHLLLNHAPVLGTIGALAIGVYGLLRHQRDVVTLALGLLVLSGVLGFAAMQTGEGAEEVLEESVPSVSHDVIHEHEEMGEKAGWASVVLGLVALGALVAGRGDAGPKTGLVWGVMALALVVSGLMVWTANLGGQIRHTEIRNGPVSQALD